jgi:membrane protease YdiL (CAAX protease family)
MNSLRSWLTQNQVAAFYLIVYAISWPMFALVFLYPTNQVLGAILGNLAVFSPALVAMLIAATAEPTPKERHRSAQWITFVIAWILSWAVAVLRFGWILSVPLRPALILFSGMVALLPAWIISSAYARTPGIRKLFSTLVKPRGNPIWILFALLIFPAVQLLGAGFTRLLGGEVKPEISGGAVDIALFLTITFLSGFLYSGGINEESGWRGFALPRLQARYPMLVAIAIVWLTWALWHLPYDIGMGTSLEGILVNRLFYNLIWSILMAWVYNRSRGSLLVPALFHPAMNTFGNNLPKTTASLLCFVALTIFAIVSDRMWEKLPEKHPAVYSKPKIEVSP